MQPIDDAITGSPPSGGRSGRLYRWGLATARHRRLVFAVWTVLIVVGIALVPRFMSSLSTGAGLWVSGSESGHAASLMASDLPATGGQQAVLVFSSRTLTVTDPGFQRVVTETARDVSAVPGISGIQLPAGIAARTLAAPGGHTALAIVGLDGGEQQAIKTAPLVAAAAAKAATGSVQIGVTGEPMIDNVGMAVENADLTRADSVGLPIALLVLLIMFGSLIAAGLPLLLAASTIVISFGAFGAYSAIAGGGLNSIMESVVVVLGLGIGIDYALFVVTRFREELAIRESASAKSPALVDGTDPEIAAAAATATAGRTVLVSGSTVIVALAPLLLINDTMMREMAIGPMVAVAVLVAAALSLLPASLAALGTRVNRLAPPLPRWLRWLRWSNQSSGSDRITALVLRRPLAVLMSGVIVLGALAAFTLQLHTGYDYGLSSIADTPSGQADTALTAAFGPGAISPVQVVFTDGGQPLSDSDLRAITRIGAQVSRDPLVQSVTSLPDVLGGPAAAARVLAATRTDHALATQLSPIVNVTQGTTVMTITARTAFDSPQASLLVSDLRDELPAALRGTGMRAYVGGATAEIADFTSEVNAKTPLVIVVIVVIALLLLAAAYRSPLVALTGLLGTMLSVGAAYGLVVLVFQKGAGESLLGFQSPGFTQGYLPLSLFAVLTGLSTDYQVFLISRIKEEWESSHDTARAITVGVQRSSRVILSAATIMIIVFASFLLAARIDLKELGFALAVVVLIDAAITRRLLVPAALRLLGSRAWGGARVRR